MNIVIRTSATFTIANFIEFKQQMLDWANQFNICCFLDNHQYQFKHSTVECLLAVNAINTFTTQLNCVEEFTKFCATNTDWLFGHVNYDFKNELHNLSSNHPDGIGFPTIFFFQPETVIELKNNEVIISCINSNPETVFEQVVGKATNSEQRKTSNGKRATENEQLLIQNLILTPRITKEKYLQTIEQLQKHILRGDCYEINFCQEFYAENTIIQPLEVYKKLVDLSPNPFACYYRLNHQFLLCASPERYVKKEDNQIISQPIKGTNKRNIENKAEDAQHKTTLQNSTKDKSENVMVVDLVRNDLSKICTEGSVKVNELFGIYSFPQVHQMISTISGELKPNTNFAQVLKATFPMGSMTGAPKLKVMQLTEQYEQTKRGIYSGCVGYIAPNGNFDFNVVIRSIMYNATNQYLSYQVGGGITFYSVPEQEYEECLVKAEAMKKVLE